MVAVLRSTGLWSYLQHKSGRLGQIYEFQDIIKIIDEYDAYQKNTSKSTGQHPKRRKPTSQYQK